MYKLIYILYCRFLNFNIGPRQYRSGSYSRSSTWFYTAFWIFLVDIMAFLFILSLNWIMTQSINNSDNLPSPPHLPDSRKVPALHGSTNDPAFDPNDIKVDTKRWKDRHDYLDLGSTDYNKEREKNHPLTAIPISSTTTYQPSIVEKYNKWYAEFKKYRDSLPDSKDSVKQSSEDDEVLNSEDGSKIDTDRIVDMYLKTIDTNPNMPVDNDSGSKRVRRKIKFAEPLHISRVGKQTFQREFLYSKDRIRWWAD